MAKHFNLIDKCFFKLGSFEAISLLVDHILNTDNEIIIRYMSNGINSFDKYNSYVKLLVDIKSGSSLYMRCLNYSFSTLIVIYDKKIASEINKLSNICIWKEYTWEFRKGNYR